MDKELKCSCGQPATHRRVGLCHHCYKNKRRQDWEHNETIRKEKDVSRQLIKKEYYRKLYYEKYRSQRLVDKKCSCGKPALRGSRYSYCLDCSNNHRMNRKIAYQNKRKKIHIPSKIRENIKSRLRRAIKGQKSKSIVLYLGCTIGDYILHIESKWQQGMSWNNYGEWHIDHIIPLSTNYNDVSLHHFSNTQPLWKEDHVRKTAVENGCKVSKKAERTSDGLLSSSCTEA